MTVLETMLSSFGNYTPLLSFIGAIIGGEETLILFAILAATGFLNIWELFIFFYLGIVVSDMLWYGIGTSGILTWLIRRKIVARVYIYWGKALNAITKKSEFLALLLTKFLYGSRIPTIMYLAKEGMAFHHFVAYTALIDLGWTTSIFFIGWAAGKGIAAASNAAENLILYITGIGIVMLGFIFLGRYLASVTKIWLRKQKQ